MTGETGAAAAMDAPAPGLGVGRIVLASLIGTAIEFYDFYIYGAVAALGWRPRARRTAGRAYR